MTTNYQITLTSPADPDVIPLLETLSAALETRFGNSGKNSFQEWDSNNPKYIFAKLSNDDEVLGCGAVRPISNDIGEVKRMYSKYQQMGIGKAVLNFLEQEAIKAGYSTIYLETRVNNIEACNFYLKNGYNKIANYGRYINIVAAACFGKQLH